MATFCAPLAVMGWQKHASDNSYSSSMGWTLYWCADKVDYVGSVVYSELCALCDSAKIKGKPA